MKNSILVLAFVCLFVSSSVLVAQTKMEHPAKVSQSQTMALEHVAAIKDNPAMEMTMMKNHSQKAGEYLVSSGEQMSQMEKNMTANEMNSSAYQSEKKYHTDAVMHQNELMAEINKMPMDQAKIKEHATKLHECISKSEMKNSKMKKK